ncbi:MAG TPA: hypothetical protein IAD50_09215 [Candidatus Egerieisoma faecipullorum]|uniref:Uncharacterized protein n=1 Tax=Candidatus Egerieisoma faecipullorum TaxID=2840963 RepID=A0A9D1LBM2_9CLOT|nr:hypothetical protein [Candidatus Egerieisoma faecipullorum]
MKRKVIASLLVAVMAFASVLPSLAAVPELPEAFNEAYSTDFEGYEGVLPDDFYTYFNTYDVKPENVVTEGDNTYYNGTFPSGSYVYSMYEVVDYRVEFDIKTAIPGKVEENAYKSALALHVPADSVGMVIEPDNEDADLTSFLGAAGVFIYFFDNILEVGVHTNKNGGTAGPINGEATTGVVENAEDRMLGAYTVSYQFQMPEGVNFTEFTSVCVQEENGEIAVYVEDNLVCTIAMSEPDEVTTHWNESYWDTSLAGQELFSGESYRKVEIKDAEGTVVATVDEAVVPVTGLFAFINRANNFGLDNLTVYEKVEESTPAPEQPTSETDATPEAGGTPAAEKTPAATNGGAEDAGSGNGWMIYVLIGAIAVVVIIFVVVIVRSKKKK